MPQHLAILREPYLSRILDGRKTIECRLTKNRIPPFNQVQPGDQLLLKRASGPIAALASVRDAICEKLDAPAKLNQIRARHNQAITAPSSFWLQRQNHPYLSLILLESVAPITNLPSPFKSSGRAWFTLDENTYPITQLTITPGSLRNSYLRVPSQHRHRFSPKGFTLTLPDRTCIQTSLRDGYFRHRRWQALFIEHHCQQNDRLWCLHRLPTEAEIIIPNQPNQEDEPCHPTS
ncbi:ASCH domain-containing protein [Mucisphaera sp.]|uniref:ASCH domain-containing protein n=1 Tax=Mucisphaera sp. TaxID=2913024 RepID=UPI003D10C81A